MTRYGGPGVAGERYGPDMCNAATVAILIPCFNEEVTIESVVKGFRTSLPSATVYVYDNNSDDETGSIAAATGAVVRCELRQGKGNVVRRMFADIDSDVYLLVDVGTMPTDASSAQEIGPAASRGGF